MRHWRLLLILIALVCFGIALSYPIRYRMAEESNNSNMETLSAMRAKALNEMGRELPTAPADDTAPGGGTQSGEPGGAPANGGEVPAQQGEADPAKPDPNDTTIQGQDQTEPYEPTGEGPSQQGQAQTQPDEPTGEGQPGEAEWPAGPEGAQPTGPVEADATPNPNPPTPDIAASPSPTPTPSPTPAFEDLLLEYAPGDTANPLLMRTPTPTPEPTLVPTPTPDRSIREGALAYPYKEKKTLDESKILPELRDIYALNQDLVGWIFIPDTVIDYPVVQTQDSDYYLTHDFYGKDNANGQIILDTTCDAYTPSYNLIISGHHMKNGSMFGNLPKYSEEYYWKKHKLIYFDTLMARGTYVIFGAFYSADYDEDEEGFRYNANIQYRLEANLWLDEVRENQLYDTGIDVGFGDEFITLTTCNRARRRDGRFVVVARKLREGEVIE